MYEFGIRHVIAQTDYSCRYDVNVLALFHYQGRHRNRVQWFKKLGLINFAGLRVHVMAVCSPGDGQYRQEILSGWPPGIDVTLLEMQSNQPIPKINGTYLWLKTVPLKARWLLRVDDDSVTDLHGLLRLQEARFGSMAIHLMNVPQANPHSHPLTRHIQRYLEENGHVVSCLDNEYEASLTSETAMQRILSCEAACQFLKDIAGTRKGPGDKCLAFAARIAEVPTATARGMFHQFHRDNMTITGGDNAHIHYVNWNNCTFRNMLEAWMSGIREPIPDNVLACISGSKLEFGRCIGQKLGILYLSSDGHVGNASHCNESGWRIVDNALWLHNKRGRPTTVFNELLTFKSHQWLVGSHMLGVRKHYLGLPDH